MNDHHVNEEFQSSQGKIVHGSQGDGPDVVLVHGTPFHSVIWRPVILQLQDHFRVHWLDLPGYGGSDKYEGQDVRLRSFARVLAEWMDHKNLTDCHLVGHDFGAATVLGAVAVEGVQAASLSVVDGVVLNPWGTEYSLLVKHHQSVFNALPQYIHEATLRAHIATASYHALSEDLIRRLVAPWLGRDGQEAYYRQISQFDHDYTAELETLYPSLETPARVFWGGHDSWVDVSVGEKLASMIPSASLHVLPDAGHLSMIDCPGLLTHKLCRWFLGKD